MFRCCDGFVECRHNMTQLFKRKVILVCFIIGSLKFVISQNLQYPYIQNYVNICDLKRDGMCQTFFFHLGHGIFCRDSGNPGISKKRTRFDTKKRPIQVFKLPLLSPVRELLKFGKDCVKSKKNISHKKMAV